MSKGSYEDAFTAFVTARRTHLRRVAYAMCGDWHLAEDLLQMSLVKLYVAWPRIHTKGNEEAYVRRIIMRTAIDSSRRPWRRESVGLEGRDRAAPAGLGPEDRSALIAALQDLTAMQRKVVVLRHMLGLSVRETADELDISTGSVKTHSARGVAKLREVLALQS